MNDIEKLVVLTAMEKAVKQELEPLRFEVKEKLLDLEEDCGADRMALKLGGEKVGSAYISRSKPQVAIPAERYGEAIDALERMGLVTVAPTKGWQSHFDIMPDGGVVCSDTGEVVDWAVSTGSYVKGATVKVDLEAVKGRLAAMPPMTVSGLIGGGVG